MSRKLSSLSLGSPAHSPAYMMASSLMALPLPSPIVYTCGFKAPLRGRHRSLRTARPGLRSAAPARPRSCGEGGGVGNSTCRHRYPMYNLAIVRHSDGSEAPAPRSMNSRSLARTRGFCNSTSSMTSMLARWQAPRSGKGENSLITRWSMQRSSEGEHTRVLKRYAYEKRAGGRKQCKYTCTIVHPSDSSRDGRVIANSFVCSCLFASTVALPVCCSRPSI